MRAAGHRVRWTPSCGHVLTGRGQRAPGGGCWRWALSALLAEDRTEAGNADTPALASSQAPLYPCSSTHPNTPRTSHRQCAPSFGSLAVGVSGTHILKFSLRGSPARSLGSLVWPCGHPLPPPTTTPRGSPDPPPAPVPILEPWGLRQPAGNRNGKCGVTGRSELKRPQHPQECQSLGRRTRVDRSQEQHGTGGA